MSLIPKTCTSRFSKYIWSHVNFVFLIKVGDGDTDYYCLHAAWGQIPVEKESNASLWTKFSMHDPAHLIPDYWSWLIPYSSSFKMTKYISDHNSLKFNRICSFMLHNSLAGLHIHINSCIMDLLLKVMFIKVTEIWWWFIYYYVYIRLRKHDAAHAYVYALKLTLDVGY